MRRRGGDLPVRGSGAATGGARRGYDGGWRRLVMLVVVIASAALGMLTMVQRQRAAGGGGDQDPARWMVRGAGSGSDSPSVSPPPSSPSPSPPSPWTPRPSPARHGQAVDCETECASVARAESSSSSAEELQLLREKLAASEAALKRLKRDLGSTEKALAAQKKSGCSTRVPRDLLEGFGAADPRTPEMRPAASRGVLVEHYPDTFSLSEDHKLVAFLPRGETDPAPLAALLNKQEAEDAARDATNQQLFDMLSVVADMLEAAGIEDYWLDRGTLLSSYRGGFIIPWDNDVDVGVLEKDVHALARLVQERPEIVPPGVVVVVRAGKHRTAIPIKVANASTGFYVDIMMYEEPDSSQLGTRWPMGCPTCNRNRALSFSTKRSVVLPTVPCPLAPNMADVDTPSQRSFRCPADTLAYLKLWYRDLSVPHKQRPLATRLEERAKAIRQARKDRELEGELTG